MTEGPHLDQGDPVEPPPGAQQHPYHDARSGYPRYVDVSGAPYGSPYGTHPVLTPDHPQASTVLVLGIVSIVACGLAGPFAWVMGNRVLAEIDAAPHRYSGRSNVNIGRILGIVATAVLGLSVVVVGLAFLGVFAGALAST